MGGWRSRSASELNPVPGPGHQVDVGRVFRQHYCTRRGGYAGTRDPRQKSSNSSRTNPGLRLENSNPYSIKCCHTNLELLIKGPATDRGPSKLKKSGHESLA